MYRKAEKQDPGVILQLSLNERCVGVLDMGSIRDKMIAWVLLAGFVFWSTLRHLSTFFFHHINLYFKWPKAPLCFVNKQNPTFENKSSDDKTVGFKDKRPVCYSEVTTADFCPFEVNIDVVIHMLITHINLGRNKSLHCRSQLPTAPTIATSEAFRFVMVS